jgi:hypothetical protein
MRSVSTSGEVKDGVEVRGDGDQECLRACLCANVVLRCVMCGGEVWWVECE